MNSNIGDLLSFDPLDTAEKLTGRSYKEDNDVTRLGMALAFENNAAKEQALHQTDDMYYGIPFAEAVALWGRLGFEVAHERTFEGDVTERFIILWHAADGILGTLESYNGDRVNSSKIYYNIRFRGDRPWSVISSGRYRGDVWVGDHDAREGLRYKLTQLRAHGVFVTPWVERPFLWLLAYTDSRGVYDYEAINAHVIGDLPANVRSAIGD